MSIRITELDAITSLQSGDYIAVDNESTGTHKFDALNIGANIGQNIANTYSSSASYAIGQYCLYDNNLYKCTTTISTPEAWNSSHWIQVTVGEGLYEKVDKVSGKGLSTNDFTNEYKQKLGGIEAGAEVNVQADWTENDSSKDDYIKNKPGNATTSASGFMSASDKQKLDNIEAGAEVNVQPNWTEDDSSKDDYIKNKPTIDTALSASSDNAVRNSAITAGINQVQGNLDTEITNRQNAVSGEQLARENADSALDGRLDTVEETLPNKANIDGSYESMTVGNAEQLTTDIRANDQTPYLFRTAGGSVDIGDREYINSIVGGTVAFNQLVDGLQNFANTETDTRATLQLMIKGGVGTSSPSVYANTFIATGQRSAIFNNTESGTGLYMYHNGSTRNIEMKLVSGFAWNANHKYMLDFYLTSNDPTTVGGLVIKNFMLIDLTLMFGSTIADYIYSLEQATAGAGVAFFKTLFPEPYYAYNAGELMSVKGLVSHDMVGFNAWDEEWELGDLNGATGGDYPANNRIRSKNYIPVLPSTTYYYKSPNGAFVCFYDENKQYVNISNNTLTANATFTTRSNVHYMRFSPSTAYGTTYNHDICINLSWDGSEDGNYEPYQKWSYPLDSDLELRGIPKIENGNLYYDGDVYEADGTVTRRFKKVVIDENSTITTTQSTPASGYGYMVSGAINDLIAATPPQAVLNQYDLVGSSTTVASMSAGQCKIYANDTSGRLVIVDTVSSVDALKAKLASHPLEIVYEANTPTTETADPYTSPQIVNDFGTEEFVISNTVDVPIPVGHNTDYPINLKAKVEMAPNSPDGDGDYIVRQTSGTNEYVSIANNSTISGLVSRSPVASGADGTYVLKATISGGTVTYSWEAE